MTPRQYLLGLGKGHVTFPDISRSLDIDNAALHYRIRVLPSEEKPENHGAFKAGGHLTFTVDAGIEWVERHMAYWAERQAARGRS